MTPTPTEPLGSMCSGTSLELSSDPDPNPGPGSTSVKVLTPPLNSTVGFGFTRMMDNPLTLGPEMSSKHRVLLSGIAGRDWAADGPELCLPGRQVQWQHHYDDREEHGVFNSEEDSSGRRKRSLLVCQRLGSCQNSQV
ncbi:hypothetical protein Tsubulata_000189, partial [Turnera subulata]